MEQIENETPHVHCPRTEDVVIPNQRQHIFKSQQALHDFCEAFKLRNYNIRFGQSTYGEIVYQLTYGAENN